MTRPVLERMLDKVTIADTGCWQWCGATEPRGYGVMWAGAKLGRQLVHRVAYTELVGPIPEGLVIDHLCRNTGCLNPDHLEPVTQRINVLRGEAPSAIHAVKTHCVNGHEYTPENTYVYESTGIRRCRTCDREFSRRRTERKRSERMKKGTV